jgi:hypothetical protein
MTTTKAITPIWYGTVLPVSPEMPWPIATSCSSR